MIVMLLVCLHSTLAIITSQQNGTKCVFRFEVIEARSSIIKQRCRGDAEFQAFFRCICIKSSIRQPQMYYNLVPVENKLMFHHSSKKMSKTAIFIGISISLPYFAILIKTLLMLKIYDNVCDLSHHTSTDYT